MEYLSKFLEGCKFSVLEAQKTACWKDWRELNYTPSYNKFYYILSGDGEIVVDGVSYFPKAGDLCLMPEGVLQSYQAINDTPYVKHWCHFNAESNGIRLFEALHVPVVVSVPDRDAVTQLFVQLEEAYRSSSPFASLTVQARMMDILSVFLQLSPLQEISFSESLPTEQLQSLVQYIRAHLDQPLSLEQLASIVHLHPNYFISFFRRYFGTTPAKYVFSTRMEHAKLLLKTSALPVSEIAEQTGFLGAEHFSRRFKEYTGYSPSDFRKL